MHIVLLILFFDGASSMEGMSEVYNEIWRCSSEVQIFKDFLAKNKDVGNHFNRNFRSDKSGDDIYFDESDKKGEIICDMYEMHRKSLSQMVFNNFVKLELEERKLEGDRLFGPFYTHEPERKIVSYRQTIDTFLMEVDTLRVDETYTHVKCSGMLC